MITKEMMDKHFKAYNYVWYAISRVVTPEQGWAVFMDCLDRSSGDETEPSNDPLIETFSNLVMYIDECHNQIAACQKEEVHSNGK